MDRHELNLGKRASRNDYDAVVVGSGPNGLAAAITIARQGHRVLVIEANETIGGGLRSAELTLPGFVHDVCSTIHALAPVSPFFRKTPLAEFGLEWVYPPSPLAHPLAENSAAVVEKSVEATAECLGRDADAYRRLLGPLVKHSDKLYSQLLGPLRFPRHPLLLARFGLSAIRSATGLARSTFQTEAARALFAGSAAHSVRPLEGKLTAAVGLMLTIAAHAGGWPVARGGSQSIADAMARCLLSLGGEILVDRRVGSLRDLPRAKVVLFDVAPPRLEAIVGDEFPARYRRTLRRFRYGPGIFKVDWALDGPIPWASEACLRAATVHVGGSLKQMATAERAPWAGEHAEQPFVLVAQASLFDSRRAPAGKHTGWAYCHVPSGSTVDATESIEAQVERYAPGFRSRILQRHVMNCADVERHNANNIGGDISGGVMDIWQLFTRPSVRLVPYRTPLKHIYICSASTPPGPGVHGMCGEQAAIDALRRRL